MIEAPKKSSRYTNRAIFALLQKEYNLTAVGKRKGRVSVVEIETNTKLNL